MLSDPCFCMPTSPSTEGNGYQTFGQLWVLLRKRTSSFGRDDFFNNIRLKALGVRNYLHSSKEEAISFTLKTIDEQLFLYNIKGK